MPSPYAPNPYAIVADTDRTFVSALRVHLDEKGFIGIVVANAAEVLWHATQAVPALVILDVRLPNLGAYQACVRVRRLPGCAALPIVLTAGSERAQIRAAAERAGASLLLIKPFSMQHLSQRLTWLGAGSSRVDPSPLGMARRQPMVAERSSTWPPPASPAASPAPTLALGLQMLEVMRRREAKSD